VWQIQDAGRSHPRSYREKQRKDGQRGVECARPARLAPPVRGSAAARSFRRRRMEGGAERIAVPAPPAASALPQQAAGEGLAVAGAPVSAVSAPWRFARKRARKAARWSAAAA